MRKKIPKNRRPPKGSTVCPSTSLSKPRQKCLIVHLIVSDSNHSHIQVHFITCYFLVNTKSLKCEWTKKKSMKLLIAPKREESMHESTLTAIYLLGCNRRRYFSNVPVCWYTRVTAKEKRKKENEVVLFSGLTNCFDSRRERLLCQKQE